MPADDVDLTLMIREGENLVGHNHHRIVPSRACHADPSSGASKSSSRDRGVGGGQHLAELGKDVQIRFT